MPRNYGQTTTSIWTDQDFVGLDLAQQAVYFMLKFQPEVTAAGTLPLTYRRWASNARDLTGGTLEDYVGQLVKRGHLAIDEDTEELLIVKFVKWDQGYSNSKRRPVIESAAKAIRSPMLRSILAGELERLGLSDMASALVPNSPPDMASDRESRFDRVVVKKDDHIATHNPQPTTREGPQPAYPMPDTLDASAEPPSMFCTDHPEGTEEPCGPCGTAKMRYKAWTEAKLAGEVATRAARAEAVRECLWCDESGIRLDVDTGRPLGRCDHTEPKPEMRAVR